MSRSADATGNSSTLWTGTRSLIWLRIRTHRWALACWPLVIGALSASTAFGIKGVYTTAEARAAYAATVGESTVSLAINGRGYDLDTFGGISVYEMGFYSLLVLPVIALHLAIRLTRGEEESGRDELLTATRVGRRAPLAAGSLVVGGALSLGAVLSAIGMAAAGLPLKGSVLYSVALGLSLLAWAGVGLVVSQLSRSSRGAHGLGIIILGALFVTRALVDGQGWSATWANPTGWLAEVRPFGDSRIWPIVALAILAAALLVAAIALRARRDLGAGMVAERSGSAHADGWLRTPVGLTWRLGRAALLGWAVGAAVWGALIGLLAPEMRSLLDANPQITDYLGGGSDDATVLLVFMSALLAALLAASFGIQMIVRMANDEMASRMGLVLATRIDRVRWLAIELGFTAIGASVVLIAGGIATDIALVMVGEGSATTLIGGSGLRATLAMLPPTLVIIAIAGLAWSVAPRLVHLGWAVLAWASVVGLLAETLHLPTWSRALSPLWHAGQVPIEAVSPQATTVLTVVAIAVAVATALRFRARDLAMG